MARPKQRSAWCAVAVLGLLAGCAAPTTQPDRSAAVNSAQPKIELLGFEGCPNTPALRDNLRAALASIGKGWTFADTDQEKLPEGDLRRGYPTPTILVDGRDPYGLPVPTAPGMGCRLYPGGVPKAEELASKIEAATPR